MLTCRCPTQLGLAVPAGDARRICSPRPDLVLRCPPRPPPLQVQLLDSDSMPLLSPELALDTEEFRRHGNLFWPDLYVGDQFG